MRDSRSLVRSLNNDLCFRATCVGYGFFWSLVKYLYFRFVYPHYPIDMKDIQTVRTEKIKLFQKTFLKCSNYFFQTEETLVKVVQGIYHTMKKVMVGFLLKRVF